MIIIAAMARNRVIGNNNAMPWHISEESRQARRLTMGNTLIMGRKTFESLGSRPLPGRTNIVISRTLPQTEGIHVCKTFEDAIRKARSCEKECFIFGGSEVYRQALPLADKMYLSYIKKDYDGDAYFPEFDQTEWETTKEEDHAEFVFVVYERKTPANR